MVWCEGSLSEVKGTDTVEERKERANGEKQKGKGKKKALCTETITIVVFNQLRMRKL